MRSVLTWLLCLVSWTASGQYTRDTLWRMMMLPRTASAGEEPAVWTWEEYGFVAVYTNASSSEMLDSLAGLTATNLGNSNIDGAGRLLFDGDDKWAAPGSVTKDLGTDFSIAFWCCNSNDSYAAIINNEVSPAYAGWGVEYMTGLSGLGVPDSSLTFRLRGNTKNIIYSTGANSFPTSATPIHIVLCVKSALPQSRVVYAYLNGVSNAAAFWTGDTQADGTYSDGSSGLQFGWGPANAQYFKGCAWGFAFATNILSQPQATNVMERTRR